ncbi:hypothetical protein CR513_13686, partial [Mucuna pruriens]
MGILPHLKMIHFNYFRSLLKVLIFTSMMNFSSTSDKGNAKGKEKGYKCSYCEKVFDNYQGLGGHQRVHESKIKQLFHQMIHFHNSADITKSNPEHGNVSKKGNYHDDNSQQDHNSLFMSPNFSSIRTNDASLEASIQANNHIGHAPSPSSVVNHQFHTSNSQLFVDNFLDPFGSNFGENSHNDNNLPYPVFVRNPSFPGYHMPEFGLPNIATNKFPSSIDSSVFFNTQANSVGSDNSYYYNMDQVSERVKNHNRDEVKEKIVMISPPKRPNINSDRPVNHEREMLQKKETLFPTKDAMPETEDAIVLKDEENHGSTSKSTNHVKEQEVDLDLSLHL